MKLNLEEQSIDIPCKKCGHKFKEKIGKLKRSPTLICTVCGASTIIEAESLRKGIESVQKSLDDMAQKLKNMFK